MKENGFVEGEASGQGADPRRLGRREFLTALAMAAAGCALPGAAQTMAGGAKGRRPNILLIVADDLGYADLGCQGSKDLLTPNVDALARGGTRFTDAHVTASVCSPSRAGLLTGRYQQRFGHEDNTSNLARQIKDHVGLPLTEITLAKALKAEGYATGVVGKWHLGARKEFRPLSRGFDEFFGFLGGAHVYLPSKNTPKLDAIYRGDEPTVEEEYLTEAFGREAVDFIRRHKDEPFFLYLPFNAIHTPQQAPKKYLDRFPDIADQKRKYCAAMLSAMDDAVGKAAQALRETGVEKDTLVIFISDNGGPTPGNGSRNDPFRGFKTQKYEGGHRIPFIVRWPGRLPEGAVFDKMTSSLDIFPTVMAAARGQMPVGRIYDGVDLAPFIKGKKKDAPHDELFWRRQDSFAARKGNWKIVQMPRGKQGVELYDLSTDIGEQKNLAAEQPEKLKELLADYKRWESQMVKPLWNWFPDEAKARAGTKPGGKAGAKAGAKGGPKAGRRAGTKPGPKAGPRGGRQAER